MNDNFKDEWNSITCGMCEYFNINADREESMCKRLDHKHIKVALSPFKSYDCGSTCSNTVCREFVPSKLRVPKLAENWIGFDEYFGDDVNGFVWLTLDDDTDVRYAVNRSDFVNGDFIDQDSRLKWVVKEYYKQSRQSPFGYLLFKEERV